MTLGKMALGKMTGWIKWRRVKWHWVKWNWLNYHVTWTIATLRHSYALLKLKQHKHAMNSDWLPQFIFPFKRIKKPNAWDLYSGQCLCFLMIEFVNFDYLSSLHPKWRTKFFIQISWSMFWITIFVVLCRKLSALILFCEKSYNGINCKRQFLQRKKILRKALLSCWKCLARFYEYSINF